MKNSMGPGRRIQNGFTDIVYQKFHTFLYDACILRDYIAEFVYNYARDGALTKLGVTTIGAGFLKLLRKSDTLSSIESCLKIIMKEGGWLKELGAYRDFAMHSAPINIGSHQLFCINEVIKHPDAKEICSGRFPLPDNPDYLYSQLQLSKEKGLAEYQNHIDGMRTVSTREYGKYDCLKYAHEVICQNM
jgi:hypothetical protein